MQPDNIMSSPKRIEHMGKPQNQAGCLNGNWKGGQVNDGRGRILIYTPNHPNPNWKGTHVYRYRLVIEKHLGRYLHKKEVVHHKNGDHSDDRLENLEIMTQAEHARLHHKIKMAGRWSYNFKNCVVCGTTNRKHKAHGKCRACYQLKT